MKRVPLSLARGVAALAGTILIAWVLANLRDFLVSRDVFMGAILTASLVATAICWGFVFLGPLPETRGLIRAALMGGSAGALLGGGTGFIGSLALFPDCNVCPAFGIVFLGVLGFPLGAVAGSAWHKHQRRI